MGVEIFSKETLENYREYLSKITSNPVYLIIDTELRNYPSNEKLEIISKTPIQLEEYRDSIKQLALNPVCSIIDLVLTGAGLTPYEKLKLVNQALKEKYNS